MDACDLETVKKRYHKEICKSSNKWQKYDYTSAQLPQGQASGGLN